MTTATLPGLQPLKLDDLVRTFIKAREKKAQLKAEYEANVAKYDELSGKIEALLLSKFSELGVDSIKTEHGTAYSQTRTTAGLADWDAFRAFIEGQDDPFMFIERRVSKSAIEQYKAANHDLPPGVNWNETRVVNFRRS